DVYKRQKHRGLGFVISPRPIPHVCSWWYISDRVAAIELSIPTSQGKSTYCRVINAFGPTLQKASENPSLLDCFYAELSKAVFALSHSPASTNQLRLPLESLYLTKDLTMFKTTLLPHYHNNKSS
ncbi:MAG: hypothetical protein MPK62_08785, partial [Alphaproteobacteria bacterium]|nr:hypothetical protein [Alphaproteobacteria bacterium]